MIRRQRVTEQVEGIFRQYPLKTAWAITIHKSQGLTFEHAIIEASAAFTHGQVYVALSRCKTLEGLVLNSPLSSHVMIRDKAVEYFTEQVGQNRPGLPELKEAGRRLLYGIGDRIIRLHGFVEEIAATCLVVWRASGQIVSGFDGALPGSPGLLLQRIDGRRRKVSESIASTDSPE